MLRSADLPIPVRRGASGIHSIIISGLGEPSVALISMMRTGPMRERSPQPPPVTEMVRLLFLGFIGIVIPAHAQTMGTMQVRLEVLPPVLTVSVSSSKVDFGQQRADAGVVTLDPATGLSSQKISSPHSMGEVIVRGPSKASFLVSMEHVAPFRRFGGHHELDFTPAWAQSRGCSYGAMMQVPVREGATGVLGEDGCATLRFGGTNPFGRSHGRALYRTVGHPNRTTLKTIYVKMIRFLLCCQAFALLYFAQGSGPGDAQRYAGLLGHHR